MEQGLITYIKNMFAMDEAPTWNAGYEGLIFYDKSARKWVIGNNEGWQVIDRKSTVVSSDITRTKWIDAFEYPTDSSVNNNYIVTTVDIYNHTTAKSIIFDIADNYGDIEYIGLRSVEFYLDGVLIDVAVDDITCYNSNAYSTDYDAYKVFTTGLSKTGPIFQVSWQSSYNVKTNLRLICVFDSPINFDEVVVNNYHISGGYTTRGCKNAKVTVSTDTIIDTTYDASISNSTLIFNGQFEQHVASDEEDSQTLSLQNTEKYALNIYSDNEFTTYGDYSLKGIATVSGSLDSFIERTLNNSVNLTDEDYLKFDIRSSVEGSSINFSMWSPYSEYALISKDINIYNKDTFQTEFIDISTVSGSAETIRFTIIDDFLENTFYIDNMSFGLPFVGTKGLYNWIDPFEYKSDAELNSTYTTVGSGISISTDITSKTYGYRSMKIDTSTTTSGSFVIRNFDPPLTTLSDYISFDMKSDTIGNNLDVIFINSELIDPIILYGSRKAKSIVFDFADSWAIQYSYTAVRSIDFWLGDTKIELSPTTDFTAYATSEFSTSYVASNAFNTSLTKIGTYSNAEWLTAATTNQRLIIVFNSDIDFNKIIINNSHDNGDPKGGIKNIKIYTTSDTITDTTYGADISNSFLIFDGQVAAHVYSNIQDDQILDIEEMDYKDATEGLFIPTSSITDIDSYQKQSFFITEPTLSGSIDYLKLVVTEPGPIYNIDNMRFDSDQETYWLDVCEYTTNSEVQDEYITTTSGLEVTTTTDMVSYGNRAIKLSADTTTSGASCTRTFSLLVNTYNTAKSVIFDFADNYGGSRQAIRSIEFYLNDSLLTMTNNFTSYVTSYYDQEWTSSAAMAFNTTLSKIGGDANTAWVAENSSSNQRLIIVFDESTEFDTIVINNAHNNGSGTNQGVKNTKIYISDNEVTSTVYGETITNSELIFDSTINEHVASNIEDDQTLAIILTQGDYTAGSGRTPSTNTLLFDMASNRLGENLSLSLECLTSVAVLSETRTVSSVILDVADNWGAINNICIRSMDFYLDDVLIDVISSDISCYSTSYLVGYEPSNIFITALSKTGPTSNGWASSTGVLTNQRIICVFDSEITFDKVIINNSHHNGGETNQGAKNVKIYTSSDNITDTTYEASISNSTLLFDGQFDEHIASNTQDDQILDLEAIASTELAVENKNTPLNVVGINKFRTYSIDLVDVNEIYNLSFTILNDDVYTDYYIDSMRFY